MRLLLIRHGESEHAVRGLVAGPKGCPGLTAVGRAQVEKLRDRFIAEPDHIDMLLCSPVPRARETAEILAPSLNARVSVDCNLCEMHVGEADGMSSAEFAERHGSFKPQEEPDRRISASGDSWNSFSDRVRTTLVALATRHPDATVAAVTHSGFLVLAFLELFDIPRPGTGARIDPDFTSITEWEHDEPGGLWRLIRLNDTTHLTLA